jgi:hypothetical protein
MALVESSANMAGLIARLIRIISQLQEEGIAMSDAFEGGGEMQTVLLNPTQKTKVTVILRAFEEHLRQALAWLDGYREEGYLYFRKLDLPAENQEAARKNIEKALNLIAQLVEQLDLKPEVENSARIVWGAMAIDWTDLTDIHARDLHGSGEVHPDLVALLDNPVVQMASLAMAIQTNFSGQM